MNPQRHYALLVGLSKYPAVGNLKGPANDLKDITEWLTNDLNVPAANIIPWPDKPPQYRKPSADDFYDWLLNWDDEAKVQKLPLGERVYVYYAAPWLQRDDGTAVHRTAADDIHYLERCAYDPAAGEFAPAGSLR